MNQFEKCELILQEVLLNIHRHRQTPLLAGFDSSRIANAAWSVLIAHFPEEQTSNICHLIPLLNHLIRQTLTDKLDLSAYETSFSHHQETKGQTEIIPLESLASWIGRFFAILGKVHPQIFEIFKLRMEGFGHREIASTLNLPTRLVRRIQHDAAKTWNALIE